MVLLKIGSVILILILLLRRKVNLSLSLFLVCILSVPIFQINLLDSLESSIQIFSNPATYELYLIIVSVIFISSVQKKRGMFETLITGLGGIFRDSRIVSLVAPALIGLLPMPGGALFSAPLVEESLRDQQIPGAFKTFINYWFRHVWEFIWPLYAGLLFFSSLSGIELKRIILLQIPFSLINIITGLIIVRVYFKRHCIGYREIGNPRRLAASIRQVISSLWPILLVIFLYAALSIPLHLGLLITAILLVLATKYGVRDIFRILFSRNIRDIMILISIVLVFQQIMKISDIAEGFLLIQPSVSMVVLIAFVISFSMGFLTGVNTAFIVIAYPILLPLVSTVPAFSLEAISIFIYVTGFAGILFSPVHLCLVLTNDYFKSNLLHVYRYLTIPVIVLVFMALFFLFLY